MAYTDENNFSGGTNTAVITNANSGGTGNTAFSTAAISGSPVFDNTHVHERTLAGKVTVTSGAEAVMYFGWAALGALTTTQYLRFYLYVTAKPTNSFISASFRTAAGVCANIRLTSGGTLQGTNAANGLIGSASAVLPFNQWIRVEARCVPSTTVGQLEIWAWWTQPEETNTALADYHSLATGAVLGASVDQITFGPRTTPSAFTTNFSAWYGRVGATDQGMLGATGAAGLIDTGANFSITDSLGGSGAFARSVSDDLVTTVVATDSFTSPADTDWGQDDQGDDWQIMGALDKLSGTKNGDGTATLVLNVGPNGGSQKGGMVTSGPSLASLETYGEIVTPQFSADSAVNFGICNAFNAKANSRIRCNVGWGIGGAPGTSKLSITRMIGGVETQLAVAANTIPVVVGQTLCFKLRTIGPNYSAKVWVKGQSEPSYADPTSVQTVDPSPPGVAGQAGFFIASGTAAAANEVFSFKVSSFQALAAIGEVAGSSAGFATVSPRFIDAIYLNSDFTCARPGTWWAFFTNQTGLTNTTDFSDFDTREAQLGRPGDTQHRYYHVGDFSGLGLVDGNSVELSSSRKGKLFNYISYPLGNVYHPIRTVTIPDIVNGVWDATIISDARAIKALSGVRFIIRLFWEFQNAPTQHWNQAQYGNDPSLFIAAWRRIWTIFFGGQSLWTSLGLVGTPVKVGTDRVQFCWCPGRGGATSDDPALYWPGDQYVDWIGRDAYPHTTSTFATIDEFLTTAGSSTAGQFSTGGYYDWYDTWKVKNKPMMLGEFGFAPPDLYSSGTPITRAAQWQKVTDHLSNYPLLKMIAYFDSPGVHLNEPWSFDYDDGNVSDTGAQSLAAAATAIQKSPLNPRINIDSLVPMVTTNLTDNGASISDLLNIQQRHLVNIGITDPGATISDLVGRTLAALRSLVDTGATITESVERFTQDAAVVTGVGLPSGRDVLNSGRHQMRLAWHMLGTPNTPQEVRRLRVEVMDLMRRYGQPGVWKHMFNADDLESGYTLKLPTATPFAIPVKRCPACYDAVYENVRGDCTVCYGVSYVSVENADNDWIDAKGYRQRPGDPGYAAALLLGHKAPKWGGFGPAFLTWITQPDVPTDVFRINEQGTFVQTINGQGIAPWYPEMGDNDLFVDVLLGVDGYTIIDQGDRWQLKMTNPVTLRGFGRKGGYQLHKVNQSFEMSHIPEATKIIWQKIPLDV